MRPFVATAILLFSIASNSNAQSQELIAAWDRTGYGLSELYAEPDFGPQVCPDKERTFSACLMALDSMLENIEDTPLALRFDGITTFTIEGKTEEEEAKTLDEYLARLEKKRETFNTAFQLGATAGLEILFQQVKDQVEAAVTAEKLAFVAGSAYGTFMREAYDPRNAFVPESEFVPKPNKYFGMGARVVKNQSDNVELDGALALMPMRGSPAEAAGLKRGDLVLAIDGVDVHDMELMKAVERIKGSQGTQVSLKIHSVCDNRVKDVVVTRGPIVDNPDWVVDSRFISLKKLDTLDSICEGDQAAIPGEPQALYVPLDSFQAPRTKDLCSEFVQLQIKDLLNADSVGMIFDIRNNGGGSLDAVACMLDSLISDDGPLVGQVPVVRGEVVGGAPQISHKFHSTGSIRDNQGVLVHYNKNVVVLVNGGSASASEIFAGTIQDMKRGWVIGERTIGKGSVQNYRPHRIAVQFHGPSDETIMIGRTTAIYTLPSGRSPQQFGVIPDFSVNDFGEEIVNDENFVTTEAKSFGSIKFENNHWEQTRTHEVDATSECTGSAGSHGEVFKEKTNLDERYKRPFVANYQMALAKDVLLCSPQRAAVK